METSVEAGDSAPSANPAQCPFSRVEVLIDLQEFAESGTHVVECPDCGATRSLEPHRGVLRFKQHDRVKRKTKVQLTALRWARRAHDLESRWRREVVRQVEHVSLSAVLRMPCVTSHASIEQQDKINRRIKHGV